MFCFDPVQSVMVRAQVGYVLPWIPRDFLYALLSILSGMCPGLWHAKWHSDGRCSLGCFEVGWVCAWVSNLSFVTQNWYPQRVDSYVDLMNSVSSLLNYMSAYLCLESQLPNMTTVCSSSQHHHFPLVGSFQMVFQTKRKWKYWADALCCQIKKTIVSTV